MTLFVHLSREQYLEFVCGCGAAIINIGITFPINKIIFRQVLYWKSKVLYYIENNIPNPYLYF